MFTLYRLSLGFKVLSFLEFSFHFFLKSSLVLPCLLLLSNCSLSELFLSNSSLLLSSFSFNSGFLFILNSDSFHFLLFFFYFPFRSLPFFLNLFHLFFLKLLLGTSNFLFICDPFKFTLTLLKLLNPSFLSLIHLSLLLSQLAFQFFGFIFFPLSFFFSPLPFLFHPSLMLFIFSCNSFHFFLLDPFVLLLNSSLLPFQLRFHLLLLSFHLLLLLLFQILFFLSDSVISCIFDLFKLLLNVLIDWNWDILYRLLFLLLFLGFGRNPSLSSRHISHCCVLQSKLYFIRCDYKV